MQNAEIMKLIHQNQIIVDLEGLGTLPDQLYTNQEIVDRLLELQSALAKGVYDKLQLELCQEKDIMIHFETLAKEHELVGCDTYQRFKNNMDELSYAIGTFIKGINGEKYIRKELKKLSMESNIKVLYNVALEVDGVKAEYDAIVIAPYGLFVIEVKNWGGELVITPHGILQRETYNGVRYNIPERMFVKEMLLRECLGDLFPEEYFSMLWFPDVHVVLKDEYGKIPISYGTDIALNVSEYKNSDIMIDDLQIRRISKKILECHEEQKSYCYVDCEAIINDYAKLMSEIELSNNMKEDSILEHDLHGYEDKIRLAAATLFKKNVQPNILKLLKFLGAGLIVGIMSYIISEFMKTSKSLR